MMKMFIPRCFILVALLLLVILGLFNKMAPGKNTGSPQDVQAAAAERRQRCKKQDSIVFREPTRIFLLP
jgi:hypothetical protein